MWILIWVVFGLPQKYEQAPQTVFYYTHRGTCEDTRKAFEKMAGNTVTIEREGKPSQVVHVRNVFKCVEGYDGEPKP